MKRRTITPNATLVQPFTYTQQALPTNKPIVQYIRQSTKKQLKHNRQSYEMQDSDLRRNLLTMGWKEQDVIKIDSDQGKSGTKRRDERTGLGELYTLIEQGKVGAVAAFDVSRLYRVLSRAEYGGFCDMVLDMGIPVITFHRIYWPTRVDNDQLNDDFKAAAMYIEDIIKGKLIAAKHRHIQYDTSYAGNAIPFGYVVLDMGDETADRKFYRIYEPHAKLIRWLFKRFRELGGNLPLLARELEEIDFRFPPFEHGIPVHVGLNAVTDGSYPLRTRAALISILTNKAYIGYYEYGGMLVSREAHKLIVNMDDFLYAYERLSGTTLDGEVQERKPRERRFGTDALLDGIVRSGELPVYVTRGKYEAKDDNEGFTTTELVVPVDVLDKAFAKTLIGTLATLEEMHGYGMHDELYERVEALKQEQEKHVTDYSKAIARIDVEIANAEMAQRVSKELGDEHGYRENTKQLVQLRRDRAAIQAKAEHASKEVEELEECYNLIECARQDWDGWTVSKRKRLVRLLVLSANVNEASPHFVRLDLAFAIPINTSISLYFYRARGSRQFWTTQEDEMLRAMFASASKEALMQALPTHSWLSIAQRGYRLVGVRRMARRTDTLTYDDWDVMARTAVTVERPIGMVSGRENIKAHNWRSDPEQVRVLLYELPPEHWAVGGRTKATQQSAFAQQQNEVVE